MGHQGLEKASGEDQELQDGARKDEGSESRWPRAPFGDEMGNGASCV